MTNQDSCGADPLCGKRVTVMGLGRHGGGVSAARFLANCGAFVTVTDQAPAAALCESLDQLAPEHIVRYRLGEHVERDFAEADLVVVNPAVKPDNRFIAIARQAGATVTSEIELFLQRCPARVVGVTGTNGKSTTASMIAAIATAAGQPAWLGGNIGHSLLDVLRRIHRSDIVVLELSSFQLYWLSREGPWPAIAVVTNFAPNHLDWHADVEHYRRAKQRLVVDQIGESLAVFDAGDPALASWRRLVRGRHVPPWALAQLPKLQLRGEHNRRCAALAAATAEALSVSASAVKRGLGQFQALPNRLNLVAEITGRQFFNDSKATTPEAAIAALEAMERPCWILLGGSDKGANWRQLAKAVGRRARGAALFGAVAVQLEVALGEHAPAALRRVFPSLEPAFAWCAEQSQSGDAVLLSPACASLDQYRDFAERGEHFISLVRQLG